MKTTTLGVFLLLIITLSCQSEYERQLAKGKDLVEKQLKQRNTALRSSKIALSVVQEDLEKCAHLSGNKRLFLTEMQEYKASLRQTQVARQQMITKYP